MATKIATARSTTAKSANKADKSPLPANKVPLVWGQWPARDVRLTITDRAGSYSFFQPFACGEWNAIQVVPWHERANPLAARLVVSADRIAQPTKSVADLAPTTAITAHAPRNARQSVTTARPKATKQATEKRAS